MKKNFFWTDNLLFFKKEFCQRKSLLQRKKIVAKNNLSERIFLLQKQTFVRQKMLLEKKLSEKNCFGFCQILYLILSRTDSNQKLFVSDKCFPGYYMRFMSANIATLYMVILYT